MLHALSSKGGNVDCSFAVFSLSLVCLLAMTSGHAMSIYQRIPFVLVCVNSYKFLTKITIPSCTLFFYRRETMKTVSNKEEKAPCSGTAALNIFALKIDLIFTRRNAVYLFIQKPGM